MSYLIVITFDNPDEAGAVRESLRKAQHQDYLSLDDSAVVVKDASGKIQIKNEMDRGVKIGMIGGGILGLLIGGVFFPFAGLLVGVLGGALVGKSFDLGIDQKFVKEVAGDLGTNSSAIFFIVRGANPDPALAALRQYKGNVYHTSLPSEAEENLRQTLKKNEGYESDPSNLVVLGFEGEETAKDMLDTVMHWQDNGLYKLEDAVTASRGVSDHVEIKQTQSSTGKFALRGSGVGLLAGLLLGGPIGGLVGGAAIGAIAGKMKDVGIDDQSINAISKALGPNTSALFLLGKAVDREKLMEELRPFKALVITTSLSEEQQKQLQEILKHEE